MRILNVAQTYFPYVAEGGRPVKVRILSKRLAERGHAVTILTADLGRAEWKASGLMPQKSPEGLRFSEDGVEAVYLPSWFRYRTLTVNPAVIGFCRSLEARFDLAHFYGLYDLLGPAVSHFCRRSDIPYVIEPMGMYRPIDRSFRLKAAWHESVGRAFWRNASQIIATSEMEQEELIQDGVPHAKITVRYNGIEPEPSASLRGTFRSKWGIPCDEILILFLSRLIPRKGADMLIEAFAQACPESGRLVIAGPEGEAGYRGLLETRARECGVESRVILTGPVYGADKSTLLADSDLFVLPSRYENFANAAAEAMAFGIPVIVTNRCGIWSLVDGNAGLVIDPEREALVGAIRKLLSDETLYARLKEGCKQVAEQLNWSRLAEQMESHYVDALAASNGVH